MGRRIPKLLECVRLSIILIWTLSALMMTSAELLANPPIVWVVDGMQRVGPEAHPSTKTSIELFAARGEYEPFQIIIRAPENGLNGVNIIIQDLKGPANQKIAKRNITLYREHYVFIEKGSSNRGGSNRPQGKGWYPEPLVPFVDPQTGKDLSGALLDAVPFELAAHKNQPIWVDVFVPRNVQAGQYKGIFTVTSQQGNIDVALTLNVWNFELPLKPSLFAATQLWNAKNRESHIELLKHKFNPYRVDFSAERELIDQYGLKMQAIPFWSGRDFKNCRPMSQPPSLHDIRTEVERHQRDLILVDHYGDEIQGCPNLFGDAVNWARRLREGGVKPLLPGSIISELMGDSHQNSPADIWVVLPISFDKYRKNIIKAKERGEDVWSYNCLIQDDYSPKWTLDFAPMNYRIQPGFISQSLNLTGLLYWVFDFWTSDPWNDLCKLGKNFPADGQFVYPGKQVGIRGVAPGMRLKWLREGIEDYEYVEILKSLGRKDFAINIAKQIGPDWRNWTRSTEKLYSARRTLGEEIHRIRTSSSGGNAKRGGP